MLRKYNATVRVDVLPTRADVVVAAPVELIGAAMTVDGTEAGSLWPEQLLRRMSFLGIFARALPQSSRSIGRLTVCPGSHELKITKDGYEPIIVSFSHTSATETEVIIEPNVIKHL